MTDAILASIIGGIIALIMRLFDFYIDIKQTKKKGHLTLEEEIEKSYEITDRVLNELNIFKNRNELREEAAPKEESEILKTLRKSVIYN